MKLMTVESHLPTQQVPSNATTPHTSLRFPRGGCIADTSRRWLRYCSRFDPSKWSRPVASQRSTARNASQSVATTKLSRDDRPQITKLQPCNFSFTKHSVTSLRGRVLLSQSSACKNKYPNFHAQVDMLNPLHEILCTHASWNQPLRKSHDVLEVSIAPMS